MTLETQLLILMFSLLLGVHGACGGSQKAVAPPDRLELEADDDSEIVEMLTVSDDTQGLTTDHGTPDGDARETPDDSQSEFLEGADADDTSLLEEPTTGPGEDASDQPEDDEDETDENEIDGSESPED